MNRAWGAWGVVAASLVTVGLIMGLSDCGPGDGCEVTATCDVGTGTGGSGTSSGGPGGAGNGGGSEGSVLGAACLDATECASGFCVDDVCCDTACESDCAACNIEAGTCTSHPAGTDPTMSCGTGSCDGAGSCAIGEHVWSEAFGGVGNDSGLALAVDSNDDIIMVGTASAALELGGGQVTASGGDAFLAKLTAGGSLVWAVPLGSLSGNARLGIGPNDTIALTSTTTGSVTCGGDSASGDANGDALFMHFDSNGNCTAAQTFGDTAAQTGSGVAYASTGEIFLARTFAGTIDLGATMTSSGSNDLYVAQVSSTGDVVWRRQFGGPSNESARDIAATGSTLLVTGQFDGNFTMGSPLSTNGSTDILLAQLNFSGDPEWAKGYGGSSFDLGMRVLARGTSSGVLMAGVSDNVDIEGVVLGNAGHASTVVYAFDENGGSDWVEAFEDAYFTWDAAILPNGQMALAMIFEGTAVVGPFEHTSSGSFGDMLILKLAADGTPLWTAPFGTQDFDDYALGIGLTSDGSVAFNGVLNDAIGFGGAVFDPTDGDGFVTLFSP